MRIGKITQPLVIQTYRQPLSVVLNIQHDDPLNQIVDLVNGVYKPDRTNTPLVLTPVLSAVDAESGRNVTLDIGTYSVKWYLETYVATSSGSINSGSLSGQLTPDASRLAMQAVRTDVEQMLSRDVYVLHSTDENHPYALVVAENGNAESPKTYVCVVTYTDTNTSGTYTIEKTVRLTAVNCADDTYDVRIVGPQTVRYDPLSEDDTVTFTAQAFLGRKEIESGVVYLWKADGVVIGSSGDEYLGYVSGQGTATLTVKARFSKRTVFTVSIGLGDSLNDIEDNGTYDLKPGVATATLCWKQPRLRGSVLPLGGQAVRSTSLPVKTLRLMLRHNGVDLTDATRLSMLRVKWEGVPTAGGNSVVTLGYGMEVDVRVSALTSNTFINGASVSPNVSILGPEQALVQGTSTIVTTVGGVQKIVTGRVFE